MPEKQIIVDDLNIHYRQSESLDLKSTPVFVHGWNSESKHLEIIYTDLNNFIALDLPGFGTSDFPKEVWSVEEYAEFLKNFLEKLEIEDPILVGHSFGGGVIIKYLACGGKARKAILVSPSGIRKKGGKIFFYKFVAKIFKTVFSLPGLKLAKKRLRNKFYKLIESEDYIEAGKLTESYKKIIREDLSEDMKKINIPVALIWGENDRATPFSQGEITQKLIKNSRLLKITDAGHFSFVDRPEEFRKIFFEEIHVD